MSTKLPYKDNRCPVRTISPKDDKSYFFGYYDLMAYDHSDQYHLCCRTSFEDRLQTVDDVMDLGVIDLATGKFEKIDETRAWNFQQAAMLQWHRKERDVVFYNVFENGEYMTVRKNLKTGDKSYAPVCANISRDGKRGLGINFPRVFDFRPGYGYSCTKDPYFNDNQPENDGVFLVDMEKGTQKLLLDYPSMVKKIGLGDMADEKFVVNHITFNPAGDKFILLLRNFPQPGHTWGTCLIVSDLEGNMKALTGLSMYSHYDWKNDEELTGFCRHDDVMDIFTVNVNTGAWERVKNPRFVNKDIHCLYSADRSFFIGDDYPDPEGYRTMFRYDCVTDEVDVLVKSYSPWHPSGINDLRTDLHNRFNTAGTKISFDTVHNGKRELCELDYSQYR